MKKDKQQQTEALTYLEMASKQGFKVNRKRVVQAASRYLMWWGCPDIAKNIL